MGGGGGKDIISQVVAVSHVLITFIVAQKYGKSQVYGVDLSPIQPAYVWDNVFFSTGDFDDESTWADFTENSFDYIHIRFTTYCIKDPVVLLQRAMK